MDFFHHLTTKGLRQYKILEKIDEGRMSILHKAIRLRDNKIVVIKLLNRDGIILRNALRKKFPQIDSVLLKLDHPNIIKILEISKKGLKPYLCVEYIPGLVLGHVAKRRLVSLRKLVEYFIQVCEGIGYLHEEAELVHRDFNPQNVIIDERDTCKLIDLDLSFRRVFDTKGIYRRSGTMGYLAPEQVRGRQLDHRIDIYAIGASMYETITGHNPYRDDSSPSTALRREKTLANHLVVTPPLPSSINRDIPELLDGIIMKCVKIDREERYQSACELKRDLEKCLHLL